MSDLIIQKTTKSAGVDGWPVDPQFAAFSDFDNTGLPTIPDGYNIPAAAFDHAAYSADETTVIYSGFAPNVDVLVEMFAALSGGSLYQWTVTDMVGEGNPHIAISYGGGDLHAQKDDLTARTNDLGQVILKFTTDTLFSFPAALRLTGEAGEAPGFATVLGDSNSATGQGHVSDDGNLYWALYGIARNKTITDLAVAGTGLVDAAKTAFDQDVADDANFILMIGANDQRLHIGNANYLTDWGNALRATTGQLSIPDSKKIQASDVLTVKTGTWAASALLGGRGMKSSSHNDQTVSTIHGTKAIVVFAGYKAGAAGKNSTAEIYVDDVLNTTVSGLFLTDISSPWFGFDYAPQALVISGLSDADHDIKVKITSADGQEFTLLFVSAFPTDADNFTNSLLCMNVPPQRTAYGFGGNSGNLAAFNSKKAAIDTELSGLASQPVDISSGFIDGTDYADDIHFNDSGHLKILNRLLSPGGVPKYLKYAAIHVYRVPASIVALRRFVIPAETVGLAFYDQAFIVARYRGIGHDNAGTIEYLSVPFDTPNDPGANEYDYTIGRREGNDFIDFDGRRITFS